MEGVLQYRRNDLFGIINGIDYMRYDPSNDKALYANYSVDSLELKKKNKDHLQTELGLPNRDVPIICIISKFMEEKGFNLLDKIWDDILSRDVQVVVLGKGDVYYENKLIRLKGKYTDKIGLWIGANEDLERRVFAGSDIFLLPSKFDFFPYKQMVSMRYGTVPIVRANGDVEDTVINYDFSRNRGTGFIFPDYSSNQMLDIINRVLMLYNNRKDIWKTIMEQGMKEDFSFDRTITEYIQVYKRAMTKN
jgi:starch synthase